MFVVGGVTFHWQLTDRLTGVVEAGVCRTSGKRTKCTSWTPVVFSNATGGVCSVDGQHANLFDWNLPSERLVAPVGALLFPPIGFVVAALTVLRRTLTCHRKEEEVVHVAPLASGSGLSYDSPQLYRGPTLVQECGPTPQCDSQPQLYTSPLTEVHGNGPQPQPGSHAAGSTALPGAVDDEYDEYDNSR